MSKGYAALAIGCLLSVVACDRRDRAADPGIPEASVATAAPVPAVPACIPSDFTITDVTFEPERGRLHLRGIVHNGCRSAAGVKLRWTAYAPGDSVAFTDEFWPGVTTNIQPGGALPFETWHRSLSAIARDALTPMQVERW
jgi:hypothetical protein